MLTKFYGFSHNIKSESASPWHSMGGRQLQFQETQRTAFQVPHGTPAAPRELAFLSSPPLWQGTRFTGKRGNPFGSERIEGVERTDADGEAPDPFWDTVSAAKHSGAQLPIHSATLIGTDPSGPARACFPRFAFAPEARHTRQQGHALGKRGNQGGGADEVLSPRRIQRILRRLASMHPALPRTGVRREG